MRVLLFAATKKKKQDLLGWLPGLVVLPGGFWKLLLGAVDVVKWTCSFVGELVIVKNS